MDFIATTPDVELFPRRAWIRATERALREAPNEALDYGDHRGRIELRRALSGYLGRVRGVRIEPERMVITQGFTQGLDLVSRVLLARGATTIAFEAPSQPTGWATPEAVGLRVVGVPVDDDGVRTDALDGLDAAAIVVTPAHQFPTGAVMAPERRADSSPGRTRRTGSSSRTTTTPSSATTATRSGRSRASTPAGSSTSGRRPRRSRRASAWPG